MLEHEWNALAFGYFPKGYALPLLQEGVSRSGGDLPYTGKVT